MVSAAPPNSSTKTPRHTSAASSSVWTGSPVTLRMSGRPRGCRFFFPCAALAIAHAALVSPPSAFSCADVARLRKKAAGPIRRAAAARRTHSQHTRM